MQDPISQATLGGPEGRVRRRGMTFGMALMLAGLLAACGGGQTGPADRSAGQEAIDDTSASVEAVDRALTPTWTECAREGGTCTFTGKREVRYGGKQAGQQLITKVLTGPVACVDASFGAPTTNYENFCSYSSELATTPTPTPTPTTWTECAREGGTCSFAGTRQIKYGGKLAGQQSIIKTLTGPVLCNDGSFGAPFSNYENFCWIGSTTAPPTPTSTAPGPRVSSLSASGPIVARSGQVISRLRISNPNGACITVNGLSNVVIEDSDIGPCAGDAIAISGASSAITVRHNAFHDGYSGVKAVHSSAINTVRNTFTRIVPLSDPWHHAIEYDWINGGTVDGNVFTGTFPSDVLSGYESDNLKFLNNDFNVSVVHPAGAAFTIGDSTTGHPGSNNYVAGNVVRQTGGVPAGVFGSGGNTVIEKNCLTAGIQAYNYSGLYVGVDVRYNVIGPGSFWGEPAVYPPGYATNIFSTDCTKVPK